MAIYMVPNQVASDVFLNFPRNKQQIHNDRIIDL